MGLLEKAQQKKQNLNEKKDTILVVDDSIETVEVLKRNLQDNGYLVFSSFSSPSLSLESCDQKVWCRHYYLLPLSEPSTHVRTTDFHQHRMDDY